MDVIELLKDLVAHHLAFSIFLFPILATGTLEIRNTRQIRFRKCTCGDSSKRGVFQSNCRIFQGTTFEMKWSGRKFPS